MAEIGDPRLLAWFMEQFQVHKGGIVAASIAAQICACSREGVMHAVRSNHLRLCRYDLLPRSLSFIPLDDVVTWQAARHRFNHNSAAWDQLYRYHPRRNDPSREFCGAPHCICVEQLRNRQERRSVEIGATQNEPAR